MGPKCHLGFFLLYAKIARSAPSNLSSNNILMYSVHFVNSLAFFQIPYYLDEGNGWGLDVDDLKRAINENRELCHPRAIVVINPGNPTGQVLSRSNIESIIKFAYQEKLFILADEVG